uniref:Uncharacterized protein n=1 Tax=Thermus scotoductus TaxID=37636 RepID=A0A346FPY1_THESC|nr:hypothetical protein [Thermus scotoductus]
MRLGSWWVGRALTSPCGFGCGLSASASLIGRPWCSGWSLTMGRPPACLTSSWSPCMRLLPGFPLALLAVWVRCCGCKLAADHSSMAPNGGPIPPKKKPPGVGRSRRGFPDVSSLPRLGTRRKRVRRGP